MACKHETKTTFRKVERMVFYGETAPQYRTVDDIQCIKCGKCASAITGEFIGV